MGRMEEAYDAKTGTWRSRSSLVLKDAQVDISIQELCRQHDISDATFY